MNTTFLTTFLIVVVSWGLGNIFGKAATQRIGEKAVFWHYLVYATAIIVYSLFVFGWEKIISSSREGVLIAVLAAIVSLAGAIGFYHLLAMREATVAALVLAVVPVATFIFSAIFLHEQVTLSKILAVVLAGTAVILVSVSRSS